MPITIFDRLSSCPNMQCLKSVELNGIELNWKYNRKRRWQIIWYSRTQSELEVEKRGQGIESEATQLAACTLHSSSQGSRELTDTFRKYFQEEVQISNIGRLTPQGVSLLCCANKETLPLAWQEWEPTCFWSWNSWSPVILFQRWPRIDLRIPECGRHHTLSLIRPLY